MALAQAVAPSRGGGGLARDCHLGKARPLGLSPRDVRRDAQLSGLTRWLTLAWRLLTWLATPVRQGLARTGKPLAGWDAGQLGRTTDRPTGVRLLNAGGRAEIPRTRLQLGQRHRWHLTPLPQVRAQVLASLGLSPSR